jgi:predicted metal-dependent phosphoesterase TrpH
MSRGAESVQPEFPVTRATGRGRDWYRGDCHVHSVHSDGTLTPQQLVVAARAAGLDFIATTDHNAADAHDVWDLNEDDDLLVIVGEEVTTATGHWLALGLPVG